jgi:hypothetical protein
MIKVVENSWRPFIVLHSDDGAEVYFDVTKRATLFNYEDGTVIQLPGEDDISVVENVEDIIKAVDGMIAVEQDKKAKEATKYMQETMARVAKEKEAVEAAQGN